MSAGPPELARLLLRWCAPVDYRDAMVADLDEEFRTHVLPARGARGARRWYWIQVAISAPVALGDRVVAALLRGLRAHPFRIGLMQDLRFSVRTVLARPGFSLVVVLALALGIGGTTLAYGVVHGVVLNPFPYPDADRLVAIGVENPRVGIGLDFMENVSPPEFLDVRASSRTLESFYAFDDGPTEVLVGDHTVAVWQSHGWGDAFRTLGVAPHLGRGFRPSEMEPEGADLVVLSHRLWTAEFGSDSTVLGRSIELSRSPHTVVGVMPPGIILNDVDVWRPAGSPPSLRPRGPRRLFQILARIRPGYTLEDVNLELATVSAAITAEHGAEHPEYEGWRLRAVTWAEANVQDYKALGFLMFAGVGFLLLLVCINIAGLYLASATRRGRELAVRRSLGAGSGRIASLLVMESLVAGLAGGALGVLVAFLGSGALNRVLTSLPDVVGRVEPSAALLVFALLVSIGAGVLTGVVPAVQLARSDIGGFLRTEGPGATATPASLRAQNKLVSIEMALALIVLVGTGAVAGSFLRFSRVDLGFDPTHLLSARFDVPYGSPLAAATFYEELERRVAELPGVLGASVSFRTPVYTGGTRSIALAPSSGLEQGELPLAQVTYSSPGYRELLDLDIVRGRALTPADASAGAPVAVVNDIFAERYLPGLDPVGQRVRDMTEEEGPWLTIVGVMQSFRNRGPRRATAPELHTPLPRIGVSKSKLYLLARTAGDPSTLVPELQHVVAELDPRLPIHDIETVRAGLAQDLAPLRIGAFAFLGLALVSVLLASLGVGSVVWFAASRRTREIGLRRALGANEQRLRWAMARVVATPALLGAFVGSVVVVIGSRRVFSSIPDVEPPGAAILVLGPLLLVAVGVAAALIPAWRASRLDPVEVLRAD